MTQPISMYNASVPVFKQLLTAFNAILDKTQLHLEHNSMAADALLQSSLYPDMYNFIRQVQITTDFAKGVSARLAGIEVPAYEDSETTIPELKLGLKRHFFLFPVLNPNK